MQISEGANALGLGQKEVETVAKIRKPGRPKKYTARQLEQACEKYFASISYQQPVTKRVPVEDPDGNMVLDDKGHIRYKNEQIITADGKKAVETCWIEPPGIVSLCLYLGIDRSTFDRYGDMEGSDEESERFRNTVTRARGRVEAYLVSRIEDKSAARGAIFNLQQNFGWKDRKEVSLDKETRSAVAVGQGMTMAEKLQLLKEAGVDVSAWE